MRNKNSFAFQTPSNWEKWLLPMLCAGFSANAQQVLNYQTPPKEIVELVDAPHFPEANFSGDGRWALVLRAPGFQPIEQVAQPVLGLAGLRVNPVTYTTVAELPGTYVYAELKQLKDGQVKSIAGLPENLAMADIRWSPDGQHFAFLNKGMNETALWIVSLDSFQAKQVWKTVNDTYGVSYAWKPDGSALLLKNAVSFGKEAPVMNPVPTGPIVQENLGGVTPSRTYQNLLSNAHDEDLMEFYLSADLLEVDLSGQQRSLGISGVIADFDYSPDGAYLLVKKVVRPYSYLVPINLFPVEVGVYSAKGDLVSKVYTQPLADKLPISFDAVLAGPRSFSWRGDQEATLLYTQAADQGDSNKESEVRDELFSLKAPFNIADGEKIFSGNYRVRNVYWLDGKALVEEAWRKTRSSKLSLINTQKNNELIKVVSERKSEDTYSDPGRFISAGDKLLSSGKNTVYTIGQGASAEGDRPFLLEWDLMSGKQDTLFKSQRGFYELPLRFFPKENMLYISRESESQAPNIFGKNVKNQQELALTDFPDPYPLLADVEVRQITYKRKDGLNLTATLYIPAGFKQGDAPLPALVWAYPREFKTRAAASQIKGSPHRYPSLAFRSPVYWVTQGYAVLDNADMPIVGEGDVEPNDTFVEQITDNAEALIDYVSGIGVVDRKRIGVGGHSYGAFMTANLLAHTDLFAAGIARSGAYNRTLTPFGFQGEARTYWQAKEVYDAMSPFQFAPQINEPILLTHGIDDENSGTFPIQSERLYAAVKGHGGIIRLVMLPKEFHGYRSREGVLHTFWEQHQWLEKYVKNKK